MPPRRRARVKIPDQPGLDRDAQQVGERAASAWGEADDPWGARMMPIHKTWAESFQDADRASSPQEEPDGPDYWFRVEMEDVDFDVHFRLGVTDEGGLVVTGLLLGDPGGTQAITTSNLHRLPIGAIYEAISRLDDVTTAVAEKARKFKGEIPTRGGQRTPDEQFEEAAEIYRQCLIERPNDPIKCVAEKLGVSSATASRRVSRARDLGLIAQEDKPADSPWPTVSADAETLFKRTLKRIGFAEEKLDRLENEVAEQDIEHGFVEEHIQRQRDEVKAKIDKLKLELFDIEERLGIPIDKRIGMPF